MAKAVLFLVSADAPFGHPLVVNGSCDAQTDEVRKPRAIIIAARHRHTRASQYSK
jgi:hypothetical protein